MRYRHELYTDLERAVIEAIKKAGEVEYSRAYFHTGMLVDDILNRVAKVFVLHRTGMTHEENR